MRNVLWFQSFADARGTAKTGIVSDLLISRDHLRRWGRVDDAIKTSLPTRSWFAQANVSDRLRRFVVDANRTLLPGVGLLSLFESSRKKAGIGGHNP